MRKVIQINNVEALSKLLDGETEDTQLKVRQNVADKFCKMYLKGLVNHELIKSEKSQLISEFRRIIEDFRKSLVTRKPGSAWHQSEFILTKTGKEIVKEWLVEHTEELLGEVLINKARNDLFEQILPEILSEEFLKEVKEYIKDKLVERLCKKLDI